MEISTGPGRDDATPSPWSWFELPYEIRLQILEVITKDARDTKARSTLARFATVCLEWQTFFEKVTFRHLTVDSLALGYFDRIVSGDRRRQRLSYIYHFWLRIKLPDRSRQIPNAEDPPINRQIFAYGITQLLRTLRSRPSGQDTPGMILELSVHSSSHSRDWPKDVRVDQDYHFRSEDDASWTITTRHRDTKLERHRRGAQESLSLFRHLASHYFLGFSGTESQEHSLHTFVDTPLELCAFYTLPPVPCIKGLLIRRSLYRQIAPRALGRILRESLVSVESFRLERWCYLLRSDEALYVEEFKRHVLPSLSPSLTRFFYTELLIPDAYSLWRPSVVHPLEKHHQMSAGLLPKVIGEYGASFTEISLCQPLEALLPRDCPYMERLEKLCFHSKVLKPSSSDAQIDNLLIRMACVAEKMPRLRVMTAFTTDRAPGATCIFRYTVKDSEPTLRCCNSWDRRWSFSRRVVSAWSRAASKHAYRHLVTEVMHLAPMWFEDTATARQLLEVQTDNPLTLEWSRLDNHTISI